MSNDEKEFDPFELESDEKQEKPRRAGVGWLALLVALAAAGGSGYLWWLEWQGGSADADQQILLADLQRRQASLQQSLDSFDSRLAAAEQDTAGDALATFGDRFAAAESRLNSLDQEAAASMARDQAEQAALFDLQQRVESAEGAVAALNARSDSPAQRLDMSEVESLLRMASERLQLFSDTQAADEALALADERLAAMEDPVYLPVRQKIDRARQALSRVNLPDLVRLEGRLAALQDAISTWPFPGERSVAQPTEEVPAEGLWARFKQTLSGLVTVRRKTAADDALLSIGDKDYLRQGLWLQLETSRLSMMRRDAALYDRSLGRAADTLQRYYDPGAATVQSALAEIEELRTVEMTAQMPDISAPWTQLRLLRQDVVEVEEQPPTVTPAVEVDEDPDAGDASG